MGYILGVDIGTQGIKAVLMDESLQVVEKAYTEHHYLQPRHNWFEHEAEGTWWNGFKKIVGDLMAKAAVSPRDVLGIGCSALNTCMLPVDRDGRPLRNAILYGIDTRCKNEAVEITELFGEDRIMELCKMPLTTQQIGPKLLWYKKNEPRLFERTHWVFTTSNYIAYKLTGRFVLDYSQAAFYGPLYDFDRAEWSEDSCDRLGIPRGFLPELMNSDDLAGTVTEKVANEMGFAPGTPVVVGTGDSITELVSAGGFGRGELTLIYGTTGIVSLITDTAPPMKELFILPHTLMKGYFIATGGTVATGGLTKWFRDNFGEIEKVMEGRTGTSAYALLGRQAGEIPVGSGGLVALPYFCGERTPIMDPLACGLIIGLTLFHTRAHIYRALLEAAAYSFRHHIEVCNNYGFEVNKVIACGGGAGSDLWVQIVSDVIGYDQEIPDLPLGSEIGAAYMAAKGVGLIDDIAATVQGLGRANTRTIRFDPENHRKYQDYYQIYRKLYPSVREEMHALTALAENQSCDC